MTILYDLETDNLLFDVTTIHCGVCYVVEENKYYSFTSRPIKGSSGSIKDMLKLLQKATLLVAHNGVKYDNAVIRKLYNIDLFTSTKYFDTLIASQLRYPNMLLIDNNNKYIPNTLKGKHSLASWGYRLNLNKGIYGKEENAWDALSEDMLNYCIRDVELLLLLYNKLKDKVPDEAMRLEQEFAYVIQRQEEHGVLFDIDKAQKLHVELLKEQEDSITKLFSVFKPLILPVGKPRVPSKVFTRLGVTTVGEHQPVELTKFNPKSGQHIVWWIEKLYGKQKWELTEKGSTKTDEESLLKLFKDKEWATPLVHYLQVKKLLGQLAEGKNAWLKLVKEDSRIHGEVNTIGAVSRRCTHNNPNLAQVPSVRAFKGHECRELFIVPKGYKMVGCDMSGLELRVFAHYLARYDNGKYGNIILNEDIHTFNQKAAGLPTRDTAKTFIYGTLYGAGDEKVGLIVGKDAKEGKRLKKMFKKNIPAYKLLLDGVAKAVEEKGFLRALDGNRYFIRSAHSALNTLLQGAGALLCKQWCILTYKQLIKEGYIWGKDFAFVTNIHDEFEIECREEIAETISHICKENTTKAGEYFKIRMRLDGEAKIGSTWADVH